MLQTLHMSRTSLCFFAAGLGAALLILACAEVPMPASLRGRPRCPVSLGAEDTVTIRVFGEEELTGDYQADAEGMLDFPFVGRMEIIGMTNTALADRIKGALQDGEFMNDPQVSVVIKEHNSARISVGGLVARSGTFAFKTRLTLVEAISQAGGMNRLADRRRVKLTRTTPEGSVTETVSLKAIQEGRQNDVQLCPGDAVYVPESIM